MSYSFNGSNQDGVCSFTTAIDYPFTLAAYIKQATFVGTGTIMDLFSGSSEYARIMSSYVNSNEWFGVLYDGSVNPIHDVDLDIATADLWVPIILVCTNSTTRQLYMNGNTGGQINGGTCSLSGLTTLRIGRNAAASEYFTGNIARVCVWKSALDATARAAFLAGTSPNSIDTNNLAKYFELNTNNGTQTNGATGTAADAGSLTLDGTYSSDHPSWSTKYLKLLSHSSAASATGVEGVVLNSTRDTVIGEFSGQAFEASLESGKAVLLIPVEDITPDGDTLTTSSTPLVSAYNSTYGTVGLGSATVIEV